ncbi:unnamed protein product [Adineta ricciae]|uniref:DUF202 domain-containing protein n=1 Tax=Adineta ricciae TaxID=249248 RepID=A0A815ICJ1_ADIRI|nr:unnamed protein product [Adineta ricciae]CAF1364250.1 unnamed protein product [Adineta ricciae]
MTQPLAGTDPAASQAQSSAAVTKFKGSFTDHLANERTFLAWTRTSLGIFAFGCAITRFGGSEYSRINFRGPAVELKPLICGIILIACGIMTLLYSIYRYYRINRQIMDRDLTEVSQVREPIIAALVLLVSAIAILILFVLL